MENQIENNTNNEDEISLIDLFAVLIRYRKLIVIGTLVVSFLVGVYLFIVPVLFPSFSGAKYVVSYSIGVDSLPPMLASEFSTGKDNGNYILQLAVSSFTNPQSFSSLYREQPIFSIDGKLPDNKVEFNKMVSDFFGKDITIEENKVGGIDIALVIPVVNEDKVDSFMSAFIAAVNKQISDSVLPQLTSVVSVAQQSAIAGANSMKEENIAAMLDLQLLINSANRFLAENVSFVHQVGEPFVVPSAQGRLTKLVIVAFAGFFVFVFIAFVLNAVSNVKADPQASKVISDAWKAGK
ncbi:MAG: hypothetical protein IKK79_05730 [Spirochaetaceae bacterium]|nr:hypothetical protein [Spirochaetaceae bacterium]